MKKAVVIGALVIAGAVGWYLGSPLFIDKTVDEPFPSFPTPEEIAQMSVAERDAAREKAMAGAAAMPAKAMAEAMPAAGSASPVLERSGTFRDADDLHKGTGEAKLYALPAGGHLVRLENLDVTNGPDLYVYLAKHADVRQAADVSDGGYLSLGRLRGNKGNQNYPVPAGTDVSQYKSVVIWCRLFGVLFSPATLQ